MKRLHAGPDGACEMQTRLGGFCAPGVREKLVIQTGLTTINTQHSERAEIGYQKRMAENSPRDSWVDLAKWRINRRALDEAGEAGEAGDAGPKAVF